MSDSPPCAANAYLSEHAELLLSSFLRLTDKPLIDPDLAARDRYRALFEARFCIVSHGTEPDPVFNYGNRAALALFEMDWEAFTKLPSRRSAEPQLRAERQSLLTQVAEKGFIDDYRGVRVSASGKRFLVEKAIIWNLVDENGDYRGQAAALYQWSDLQ